MRPKRLRTDKHIYDNRKSMRCCSGFDIFERSEVFFIHFVIIIQLIYPHSYKQLKF